MKIKQYNKENEPKYIAWISYLALKDITYLSEKGEAVLPLIQI